MWEFSLSFKTIEAIELIVRIGLFLMTILSAYVILWVISRAEDKSKARREARKLSEHHNRVQIIKKYRRDS